MKSIRSKSIRPNCICLSFLAVLLLAGGVQAVSQQSSITVTGTFDTGTGEDILSYPWYEMSLDGSGERSTSIESAYSFFSEYYMSTGEPVVEGIVSTPMKFDIKHSTPSKIHFSGGVEMPYAQYSQRSAQGNELWVQGVNDWSQYVVAPEGSGLQLVAFSPAGGEADFYEISQTDIVEATNKRYQFYSGYNSMSFAADQIGRHILLFVLDNQPSNVIVVDVISSAPSLPTQSRPFSYNMPPFGQQYYTGQYPSQSYATFGIQTPFIYGQIQYPQHVSPHTATQSSQGDTPVTIQTSMKGYDVYLDGVLLGKEGTGGDLLDGVFKFKVVGGQTHTVRIFDGVNNYEKPMYFEKWVQKVINVPPAATVYVSGGSY